MTDRPALFDAGLQPERTELAWRRTALSIAVGSLAALKVLPDLLGSVLWLLPGLGGLAFAAVLWIIARERAKVYTAVLLGHRERHLPGGGLLLIMACFALTAGGLSLAMTIWLAVNA